MKLKYVGDMPSVSKNGVGFDHTKVDKYTYLTAAVELLEALSYGATEATSHLYNAKGKDFSSKELLELFNKYCNNLDELLKESQEKSNLLVQDLIDRVNDNGSITSDEKRAWLNNIDMMRDYYLQHVTNATAYKCALEVLAQAIHDAKVQEVNVPLFRNYGIVLNDLKPVLEFRKAAIDMELEVNTTPDGILATAKFSH